jgi:hypothetical protein
MAGGIFVDQPYHPNPKCLVFSFLLMLAYWFLPATKNVFMLFAIFLISYIALAWYDEMYDCSQTLLSGTSLGPNTFDAIFKPQKRSQNKIKNKDKNINFVKDQEQSYLSRVYLFHVLAVAPLVIYVGYNGLNTDSRAFPVLLTFGVLALMYHGTRLFIPRETSK